MISGESDYWSLSDINAGLMEISLSWVAESVDFDIYLYDSDWNLLISSYTSDNPETLSYLVLESGMTFHLEIYLYQGSTSDYSLTITHY